MRAALWVVGLVSVGLVAAFAELKITAAQHAGADASQAEFSIPSGLEYVPIRHLSEHIDRAASISHKFEILVRYRDVRKNIVEGLHPRHLDADTTVSRFWLAEAGTFANIHYFKIIPNREIVRWRLASIFGAKNATDMIAFANSFEFGSDYAHIGPELSFRGLSSDEQSVPRQSKADKEQDRANCGKSDLRPCGPDLIFCGICAPRRGPGGLTLGFKIIGLVIIGALFAIPGALGLIWVFDNPNRKRKLVGGLLTAGCLPATLTFYGWAFTGSPGWVWGLCGERGSPEHQESDGRNDDTPMASIAAIRNHAGNAPRLIFTVMEPSVSGIPASVNRFAELRQLGMPSGYRGLPARDRVGAWQVSGTFWGAGVWPRAGRAYFSC